MSIIFGKFPPRRNIIISSLNEKKKIWFFDLRYTILESAIAIRDRLQFFESIPSEWSDAFSPRGENLFGNFKSLKWNYGTESIVFNAIGSRFERNLQKYANAIPVWIERLLYKINSLERVPPLSISRNEENLENLEERWQIGNLCNEGNIRHATSCVCPPLLYVFDQRETLLRNRLFDGQTTFFSCPLSQKRDQKSSFLQGRTKRNRIRCFINKLKHDSLGL